MTISISTLLTTSFSSVYQSQPSFPLLPLPPQAKGQLIRLKFAELLLKNKWIIAVLLIQPRTDALVRLGIPNPLMNIPEQWKIIPIRGSARITTAVIQMKRTMASGVTQPTMLYVGSFATFRIANRCQRPTPRSGLLPTLPLLCRRRNRHLALLPIPQLLCLQRNRRIVLRLRRHLNLPLFPRRRLLVLRLLPTRLVRVHLWIWAIHLRLMPYPCRIVREIVMMMLIARYELYTGRCYLFLHHIVLFLICSFCPNPTAT